MCPQGRSLFLPQLSGDKEKVWTRKPVTALKGWTTNRAHYLTGELAKPYFFLVEWSSVVTDIREHYPLFPLEETLAIAKDLVQSRRNTPGVW
jgi:hypothetical protein